MQASAHHPFAFQIMEHTERRGILRARLSSHPLQRLSPVPNWQLFLESDVARLGSELRVASLPACKDLLTSPIGSAFLRLPKTPRIEEHRAIAVRELNIELPLCSASRCCAGMVAMNTSRPSQRLTANHRQARPMPQMDSVTGDRIQSMRCIA